MGWKIQIKIEVNISRGVPPEPLIPLDLVSGGGGYCISGGATRDLKVGRMGASLQIYPILVWRMVCFQCRRTVVDSLINLKPTLCILDIK